jgi:hypothetical protein
MGPSLRTLVGENPNNRTAEHRSHRVAHTRRAAARLTTAQKRAVQRTPLRDAGAGAGLSQSPGGALSRYPRIHGTTKRQVAVMFAEERPALQPLPWSRFAATGTASAPCVWIAASRSRPRTIRRRPGGSGAGAGAVDRSARTTSRPGGGPAAARARPRPRAAGIASPIRIARSGRRVPGSRRSRARHTGAHLHTVCTYIQDHEGAAGVHPRRPQARQEVWSRRRRRRREGGAGAIQRTRPSTGSAGDWVRVFTGEVYWHGRKPRRAQCPRILLPLQTSPLDRSSIRSSLHTFERVESRCRTA